MNNTITHLENGDFKVEKNETCIVCNEETHVPMSLHVDFRTNYVDGAGQLCNTCANRIKNRFTWR